MNKNKEKVPKIRFPGFTEPWEQRKLGDMCDEFKSGSSILAKDICEQGEYPVYGGNGLRGYTATYNHDGIYALIGRQGALCGNMNKVYGKAYFTEHAVAVKANKNNNTDFLFFLLDKMNLRQYSGQSAQPGLAVNKLIELITLVPNCSEQKLIGIFFNKLDNLITLHQRKLNHLKDKKKGLLQKMFPKNGELIPELRFPEFTAPWEQRKLGEIVDFLDEQRKPLESGKRESGPYPYYGASGIIDYVKDYIFYEELILLSEDGANIIDRNYRVCFLAQGKYWVNNHAHVLKAKKNYSNGFICESLERLNYDKYNTGTAQPKLNQEVCRNINIWVPKLDEQKKIFAVLNDHDNLITLHQRKLDHLKEQKKALLQQMFI